MATKRVNEGGHVDGEDSNELPSVVENAGTAAASGARRVVALLQVDLRMCHVHGFLHKCVY
jgi:hypothetical protein